MSRMQFRKEDMQDDSYNALAHILQAVIFSHAAKDPAGILDGVDIFYSLLHSRMKATDAQKIRDQIDVLRKKLLSREMSDGVYKSKCFDETLALWRNMTEQLNKMGILFRMFSDPNSLVTQRSDL